MRKALAVLAIMLASISASPAQVSFGFTSPGVSIGVNLPVYPELVRVPGYPVYYAPQVDTNYFFYDGLYWVFDGVNWYASAWYNGPWHLVVADAVPFFLLRVPVRYYREPPVYFRGWALNAPPRWGVHWGNRWERNHRGWDRWDRHAMPAPAPLPTYQRRYTRDRYPGATEQRTLESRNYHYRPRDRVVQQHVRQAPVRNAQAPQRARSEEQARNASRNARPLAPSVTANRAAPPGEQRAAAQRSLEAARPHSTPRAAPPAMAHRAPPPGEQRAAAQRSLEAARPHPTPRTAPPAMAHRGAPPAVAQDRGPQRPQRAEAPRPQPRGSPQAQARGSRDRGSERAAAPGNSTRARDDERRERHNG